MRSQVLPVEHLVALFVNTVVVSMAVSSLAVLIPHFLRQSAKLTLLKTERQQAELNVQNLQHQAQMLRISQNIARKQANLVPNSRVSIFWTTD